MANAGLNTFSKIEQTNARELELIVNRHPPFGNLIRESVIHFPKYEVTLQQLPRYSSTTAEIVIKVNLKNQAQLLSRRTAPDHHYVSLIVGNSDNTVVFQQKVLDLLLLKCGNWSKKIDVAKASNGDELSVNLISSEYVGLDIRQKFVVYFSAARKFGTENSYNMTDFCTGQRPQHSNLNPLSATQASTHREYASSLKDQDLGNIRECNHFCKNKNLCAHDCCKVGVTVRRKRSANQESTFSSYLKDLRNRCDTLVQTPVKRLKMKMIEESLPISMQEFAYKPKTMLPPVSWCGMNQYKTSKSHLTADDCAQLPDIVCLTEFDRDLVVYVENVPKMMAESTQIPTAPPAHHQSSTVWGIPETSGARRNSTEHLSQSDTRNSAKFIGSTATSKQGTLCESASSIQIPTVSFELGNEWDDCDDFDDEDLLHASEISLALGGTKAESQILQCVEYNMSGRATSSTPVFISCSQAKPCVNTVTTPLRSGSAASPEIRKLGPSPVSQAFTPQKRVTLDWNKKGPDIFCEGNIAKSPENLSKQPHGAQVTRRLDFFYTMSASSTATSLSLNKSNKEEEAFLGIFDGIF